MRIYIMFDCGHWEYVSKSRLQEVKHRKQRVKSILIPGFDIDEDFRLCSECKLKLLRNMEY